MVNFHWKLSAIHFLWKLFAIHFQWKLFTIHFHRKLFAIHFRWKLSAIHFQWKLLAIHFLWKLFAIHFQWKLFAIHFHSKLLTKDFHNIFYSRISHWCHKLRCHTFSIILYIGSLFNGIPNFLVYLMPKQSLKKNTNDTFKSIDGGVVVKELIPFRMILIRKLIAWLDFELDYNCVTVPHINHNATKTAHLEILIFFVLL